MLVSFYFFCVSFFSLSRDKFYEALDFGNAQSNSNDYCFLALTAQSRRGEYNGINIV